MADKSVPPEQVMASLFEGKSRHGTMALLARLERGGASIYRSLAGAEKNAKAREALLAAAKREDDNAALMSLMTTAKDKCEKCGKTLAAGADAMCCSFQCTFCPDCAAAMSRVCPNCSGELSPRVAFA